MNNASIVIDLVFCSASGRSILDAQGKINSRDLDAYAATEKTRTNAVDALKQLGFEIVGSPTVFGVSVLGSLELVQQVFGEGELQVPESLSEWIETVRIPPSGEFYSP